MRKRHNNKKQQQVVSRTTSRATCLLRVHSRLFHASPSPCGPPCGDLLRSALLILRGCFCFCFARKNVYTEQAQRFEPDCDSRTPGDVAQGYSEENFTNLSSRALQPCLSSDSSRPRSMPPLRQKSSTERSIRGHSRIVCDNGSNRHQMTRGVHHGRHCICFMLLRLRLAPTNDDVNEKDDFFISTTSSADDDDDVAVQVGSRR